MIKLFKVEIFSFLFVCIISISGFSKNYTYGELKRIRAGYEQRREDGFELLRGKELKRAKVIPPIFSDGSNFSRQYSYSLLDYAFKCFWLGEDISGANAALKENADYYIGYPRAYSDKDSFYWAADELCKMLELFGTQGSLRPGLIQKDVEERIFLMMWQYSQNQSKVSKAEYKISKTWYVDESENHHVQRFYAAWHFAKYLKEHPRYKELKYDDGYTASEHYAAWNAYIKEWLRERGRKGLFIEMANDSYGLETLKGVYNFYDFGDEEMKRLSQNLLDLYWASWAQEQIAGVRGGAKSRVYPSQASQGDSPFRKMAWYYLAIHEKTAPYNNLFTLVTSAYRMPLIVMDIALNRSQYGSYEVVQRRLGQAEEGFFSPPDYHVKQDKGLLRYSYCTPEFIAGSFMCESLPYEQWVMISSQNRWAGVVFQGEKDARIYPFCRTGKNSRAYNQFWGVQKKGAMIFQRLDTVAGRGAYDMRFWFSKSGLYHRIERGGWVFVESSGAYAGFVV